jgi:hypothetical protein
MQDYYRGRFQRKSKYSTEFVFGATVLIVAVVGVIFGAVVVDAFLGGFLGH